MREPQLTSDIVYNVLVATASVGSFGRRGMPWEWRRGVLGGIKSHVWKLAWRWAGDRYDNRLVRARIHGEFLQFNFGHPYPLHVQIYETYNAPLVELVNRTAAAVGRPVVVVDVGAGVGDTAALLAHRCPSIVEQVIAIEGGERSFSLLVSNLDRLNLKSEALRVLLSDQVEKVPTLVPVHRGTASLVGEDKAEATTLDHLFASGAIKSPDVIKVDVDGFDGRVLAGGRTVLLELRPTVIFEWSPQHLRATNNSPTTAFRVLFESGYHRLLWFDKFGRFMLYTGVTSAEDLKKLEKICLESDSLPDWHFDVIALPDATDISLVELASLDALQTDTASRSSILRWWRS